VHYDFQTILGPDVIIQNWSSRCEWDCTMSDSCINYGRLGIEISVRCYFAASYNGSNINVYILNFQVICCTNNVFNSLSSDCTVIILTVIKQCNQCAGECETLLALTGVIHTRFPLISGVNHLAAATTCCDVI